MAAPESSVRIVEVGPRDGLQNIRTKVPTQTKIELIRRLHHAGLRAIEVTSVVSPKAIPQLSDSRLVLESDVIQRLFARQREAPRDIQAPVLVPNTRGLQAAIQAGAAEVAVFVSASEGFSRANINCSVDAGLERAGKVAKAAHEGGIAVRGYVSCIFSCPYDGPTPQASVLHCVQKLLQMGCYEVSLGDTLGTGTAADVKSLLQYLFVHAVPPAQLAGHLHDTYTQGVANVWAAYESGLRVFDSSIAGLGGCPYAPGAKGNVATEDLVTLFEHAGVSTGVNRSSLVQTAAWIANELGRQYEARARGERLTCVTEAKCQCLSSRFVEHGEVSLRSPGSNTRLALDRPKNASALTASIVHRLTSAFENADHDMAITRIAACASGDGCIPN